MSHLALAEHTLQSLILCRSNDHWGLHGKISARLQTNLLIQSQDSHCKSPRLRTVSAQFVHSHNHSKTGSSAYREIVVGRIAMQSQWLSLSCLELRPQKDVRLTLGPVYPPAPSSTTASSTAYGSTTRHCNYSTVERRPSERQRFLMVYPCAHAASLATDVRSM
jgi:hypothetical protein